jgi:CRP-like cAMP-binding protein
MITKLWEFAQKYPVTTINKDETVARADEEQLSIFYLEEGFVRQFILSPNGEDITVNIYRPGSYFYLAWVLGYPFYNHFFETITKSRVRKIPTASLTRFLENESEVSAELNHRLIKGLQSVTQRLEVLAFGNARERVAFALHNLASRFGKENGFGCEIGLPVTHKLVATIAGLARETTSMEILWLKNQGLIKNQNRRIAVTDMARLAKETGLL